MGVFRVMLFMELIRLVRYRFFLFAGMFPYLLGQAVAYNVRGSLNWSYFWVGFTGIFFVLVAVELFNEYFDAKDGGDRIFSQEQPKVPKHFYPLGVLALLVAFLCGLYLSVQAGWPILVFSFFGFLGSYFYVGPPVKWAYRGMGEVVIALSYGPLMILGSYYVQMRSVAFVPFFVSMICALSMFSLAIVNEIPDYYQDRLSGKWNLVVRLGKQGAIVLVKICFVSLFVLLCVGTVLRIIPLSVLCVVVTVPWIFRSIRGIEKDYDNPKVFRLAVNTVVVTHIVLALSLGIGFLGGRV